MICQRCERECMVDDGCDPSKYCHRCAQKLVERYEQALEDIQGHGVTLPAQKSITLTDEEKRWYARGLDSQRRIAMEALKPDFTL